MWAFRHWKVKSERPIASPKAVALTKTCASAGLTRFAQPGYTFRLVGTQERSPIMRISGMLALVAAAVMFTTSAFAQCAGHIKSVQIDDETVTVQSSQPATTKKDKKS